MDYVVDDWMARSPLLENALQIEAAATFLNRTIIQIGMAGKSGKWVTK
jgi:hypothetical protein